jgi:competence CoiA-like predicted nuclease
MKLRVNTFSFSTVHLLPIAQNKVFCPTSNAFLVLRTSPQADPKFAHELQNRQAFGAEISNNIKLPFLKEELLRAK